MSSSIYSPVRLSTHREASAWLRAGGEIILPKPWIFHERSTMFVNTESGERTEYVPDNAIFTSSNNTIDDVIDGALQKTAELAGGGGGPSSAIPLRLTCDAIARASMNAAQIAALNAGLSVELTDAQRFSVYDLAISSVVSPGQKMALQEGALDMQSLSEVQLQILSDLSNGFAGSSDAKFAPVAAIGALLPQPVGEGLR